MSAFTRLRRLVARRIWIVWSAIVGVALIVSSSIYGAVASVGDERDAWGEPARAWVATEPIAAGEQVDGRAERRTVPSALLPDAALGASDELAAGEAVARQDLTAGAIITEVDMAGHSADAELAPPGWTVVAIREPIPSMATVAARGSVTADGAVLAAEAIVIAIDEDVIHVAVPAADAAAVAAAATASRATLLLSG